MLPSRRDAICLCEFTVKSRRKIVSSPGSEVGISVTSAPKYDARRTAVCLKKLCGITNQVPTHQYYAIKKMLALRNGTAGLPVTRV